MHVGVYRYTAQSVACTVAHTAVDYDITVCGTADKRKTLQVTRVLMPCVSQWDTVALGENALGKTKPDAFCVSFRKSNNSRLSKLYLYYINIVTTYMTSKVRLDLITHTHTAKPSKSHKGPCCYIILLSCARYTRTCLHHHNIPIPACVRVSVHCIITREVHNINARVCVCVIYTRTSMRVLIVVK